MPYLKIQTNLHVGKKASRMIMREASSLFSRQLEKSENLVVVTLQPDTAMLLAGTDEPVAYLELKSVGLPGRKTRKLSRSLCELIVTELGLPKSRIYVKFIDGRGGMWGWTGDSL